MCSVRRGRRATRPNTDDRARFFGRARGVRAPAALDRNQTLSHHTGPVLDPDRQPAAIHPHSPRWPRPRRVHDGFAETRSGAAAHRESTTIAAPSRARSPWRARTAMSKLRHLASPSTRHSGSSGWRAAEYGYPRLRAAGRFGRICAGTGAVEGTASPATCRFLFCNWRTRAVPLYRDLLKRTNISGARGWRSTSCAERSTRPATSRSSEHAVADVRERS